MYYVSCVQSAAKVEHKVKQHRKHQKRETRSFKILRFIVLMIVMLISFFFGAKMNSVADSGTQVRIDSSQELNEARFVYVEPGDTLWTIAKRHAPKGEDIRKYIYKIEQLNQLDSSLLKIGQALELP